MTDTTYYSKNAPLHSQDYLAPQFKGLIIADDFVVADKAREGGMGDVFFCRNTSDKKFYALKTFLETDQKNKDLFKKEALFSLSLERHPNLVHTYTVVTSAERLYLVMELLSVTSPRHIEETINGHTLAYEMNRRTLSFVQAITWAIECCYGMEYLFKKGMKAHKDLKPSNLFITNSGHLKIGDFGLAGVNKKGGTIGYCPPEMFKGHAELDQRSDIYSFGLVLYQMLNGGKSLQEKTCWNPSNKRFRGVDKDALALSPCSNIIAKCLAFNKKSRYQTFQQLRQDLEKLIDPQLVHSPHILPFSNQDLLLKANAYLRLGEYAPALKLYNHLLRGTPSSMAYNNRALAKEQLGKEKAALSDFTKALQQDPLNGLAYYNRGNLKRKRGDVKGAIADYTAGLRTKGPKSMLYNNRAWLRYELGFITEGLADLDKGIKAKDGQSNKYILYTNRGCMKIDKGEFASALEDLQKAIQLNPACAQAYNNLGLAYYHQQDREKAAYFFNKAQELGLMDSSLYNNLGLIALDEGDFCEAQRLFNQAIVLDPSFAQAHNNLGLAYYHQQDREKAAYFFNKAQELGLTGPALYNNLGLIQLDDGNLAEALELFNHSIELDASYALAYNNRGLLKAQQGDEAGAIQDYTHAIQLANLDVAYWNRGNIKLRQKAWKDAVTDYTTAISLNPAYAESYACRGEALECLKQYDEAERDFQQYLALCSDKKEGYKRLLSFYEHTHQTAKASALRREMGHLDARNKGTLYEDERE